MMPVHPMDTSMMSMMMMGMPMMPMSDDMRAMLAAAPASMEDSASAMTRMKSRAQLAHEAADAKMKQHLRMHDQRSEEAKAPCKHRALAPQMEDLLEAPHKKAEPRAPRSHGRISAAPAAMDIKTMMSQPLTQMNPTASANGAMSAALVQAPQMMSMPMMQYPMQSPAMGQPMMSMPMMAPGAFPPNVVAMDSMNRQS